MTAQKWTGKDPNDVADYWFDWTAFLGADETITAATVTVHAGLTKVSDEFTDKTVRVRVSGGAAGKYDIDCLITTDSGQVFEDTRTLTVKERKSA